MEHKFEIKLENGEYVVYRDEDPLDFFNCERFSSIIALKLATVYLNGYKAGYSQAGVDENH